MQAMFVDDEYFLLDLMKKYFQLLKIPLDTYSTGTLALEALERKSYELILLDYNLPGTDIRSFIKSVMTFSKETKIIITSGEDREFIELEMDDGGTLIFLQKPFTITHLIDKINEVFPEQKIII